MWRFFCTFALMSLEEYIKQLEAFSGAVPELVKQFVRKNSGYLLGAAKRRFYNFGVDGDGVLIGGGQYAEYTIKLKKKSPYSRTSHITLRDTGNWYKSLFVAIEDGMLFMKSTDTLLTNKLIDGESKDNSNFKGYGEAIMEFTNEELNEFEDIIFKQLYKYLEKKFQTNIEIDL